MTNVHVSSTQFLTHGQSLSCFCENDYYVDELTSFTVTCQADVSQTCFVLAIKRAILQFIFRVDRQPCTVSAMKVNAGYVHLQPTVILRVLRVRE